MPTTPEINLKDDLHATVGPDATSTFETGGNYAGSDPTANAGSESLYSAAGLNSARSTDDDLEDDEDEDDDLEDEDDDLDEDDEDDEDEDDDLEDDDDDDEDDEDLEDEDDDVDEDEDDEDEDDDDEDDELSAESSDTIRGRNTANARTAIRR